MTLEAVAAKASGAVEIGPPVVTGVGRGSPPGPLPPPPPPLLPRVVDATLEVVGVKASGVVEMGLPSVMGVGKGAPPGPLPPPPPPLLPPRDAGAVGQLSAVGTVVYASHPTVVLLPIVAGSRGTLIPPQLQ